MRIVKNGDVHVSAPIGMPKKEVERFIEEHREWIAEARKKTYESHRLVLSSLAAVDCRMQPVASGFQGFSSVPQLSNHGVPR